jgi:hypothetical protein
MKLTILGNNGGYPKGNGACSGYLLENEQVQVIFDLGAGTLSNLLSINDGTKLDAVLLHICIGIIFQIYLFFSIYWKNAARCCHYTCQRHLKIFMKYYPTSKILMCIPSAMEMK